MEGKILRPEGRWNEREYQAKGRGRENEAANASLHGFVLLAAGSY
jgi:hypothetical protein